MHNWTKFSEGLARKTGISTSLAPLVTQCNQLTTELGKFAPKSRIGTISIFLKHCPELKFQKVVCKAHAIFRYGYQ